MNINLNKKHIDGVKMINTNQLIKDELKLLTTEIFGSNLPKTELELLRLENQILLEALHGSVNSWGEEYYNAGLREDIRYRIKKFINNRNDEKMSNPIRTSVAGVRG